MHEGIDPLREGDHETALRRLQEADAEERISREELDGHLGQALAAATYGALASALAPLPTATPDTTIAVAGGLIQRGGVWRVPRTLRIESAYGRVHLDLSRATIEHPAVDIELELRTGGARITVPRDAIVDTEGLRTRWRDVRYKTRRRPPRPGGPIIRIRGTMKFGQLRIRHAWR